MAVGLLVTFSKIGSIRERPDTWKNEFSFYFLEDIHIVSF